jgi:kelch-like protein 20
MNTATVTGPTPMDIYDASNASMGPSSSPARLPYISEKHPRHTLEAINVLRKHRELCDVVLIVGQRRIFGHRVVLSACSPYFHAMFTGELAESRQTEASVFKLLSSHT